MEDRLDLYVHFKESRNVVGLTLCLKVMPILTITYGLQYFDKAVLSSASLFGIIEDLVRIYTIIHESEGLMLTFTGSFDHHQWSCLDTKILNRNSRVL